MPPLTSEETAMVTDDQREHDADRGQRLGADEAAQEHGIDQRQQAAHQHDQRHRQGVGPEQPPDRGGQETVFGGMTGRHGPLLD